MSSHPNATDPATPAVTRHAASVLLMREQRGAVEVLLTRRHENMSFMGGLWVFPGGTLCAADTSAESIAAIAEAAQLDNLPLRDLDGNALPPATCLGLAVAAIRETFEECGVLLARTADGEHCDDESLARLQLRRRTIVSQPDLFATSLRETDLRLPVRSLVYWSHWITPSVEPKRFDTHFFLASAPPGQVAAIDSVEATEMIWMTPAALIAAAHDGTMKLSRPTLYNLMELDASVRQHVSLTAILAAESHRDIAPVLPKVVKAEQRMIVMPWDPQYHSLAGSGAPQRVSYPRRLCELPSRTSER